MSGLSVFTKTLAASEVVTISGSDGVSYISVLCKTDNSAANGIVILGTGNVGGTGSTAITLLAGESCTISVPDPYDIGTLTITAGASSTGVVVSA
jgi:hypothetical protein|tara:strand:- start:159 stop:443 length:285 start_codon:yes stop_codon:yes gene_type:complete